MNDHDGFLRIAHSPCPNDTFIFHAWSHGLLPGAPQLNVSFADIDVTSQLLAERGFDLLKISAAALPLAQRAGYQLVHAGGAVGRGCGPLLLTRQDTDTAELSTLRLAIPSLHSTAFRLLRGWMAQELPAGFTSTVEMPFERIMPAVASGEVGAGLVIHEARFTFAGLGLHQVVDLGVWWESVTGLPVPLGVIVARDDTADSFGLDQLAQWCGESLRHAWAHPEVSRDYIAEHADEMSPEVQQQHIELYVNEFSENLGEEGQRALEVLLNGPV